MFICNCTLASPSKCFNCKNYSTSFFYGTSSENWFKYMGEVLGFDSDRYELVEKKDWKINDLKLRLEHTKTLFKENGNEITRLQKLENEYAKHMMELEKELKELEK